MNINWFNSQVPYMDTLMLCASIPHHIQLADLYNVKKEAEECKEFTLTTIICFLGAHYMTYIRKTR